MAIRLFDLSFRNKSMQVGINKIKNVIIKSKNKHSKVSILLLISFSFLGATVQQCSTQTNLEYFEDLAATSDSGSIEDRFYIRLDTDYFTENGREPIQYELSTEDTIGLSDCGINIEDSPSEDKYCTLDINEMDLLGIEDNAVPLIYNVPEETCVYTSFFMPWHWNQQSGFGPSLLFKFIPEEDDSGTDEEDTEEPVECYRNPCRIAAGPCRTYCDSLENIDSNNVVSYSDIINDVGSNLGRCVNEQQSIINAHDDPNSCPTGWSPINEDNSLSKEFCGIFDQDSTSEEDNGLSNCCLGRYDIIEFSANATNIVIGETADWGGNIQECIGGPLRIYSWDSYVTTTDNIEFPVPDRSASWDQGLRERVTIELPALVSSSSFRSTENLSIHPQYSSIAIATHYEDIEDRQWSSGDACEDCPQLYKSRNESSTPNARGDVWLGYPYFTLECLDEDFEATHRVHLSIREWNTLEEFLSFQDSSGSDGDPDIEGKEGDDCEYYEPDEFDDNECNDLLDIDDLGGDYPRVNYDQGQ